MLSFKFRRNTEKPREQIYKPIEDNDPVMRYVTIGEVLDKQFDDKTGVIRPKHDADKNIESVFTKSGSTWLYTHANGTRNGLDQNFGLKHYILMGFECREIAPTSNNKQSSRSHVVVSLQLNMPGGKTRSVYVCDLAGVENVFDCKPGSADIIRMKAKAAANKNYSNILKGEIEEWDNLKSKRTGNLVKYVHKDIHITTTTPTDPNCWPDGNVNTKSGESEDIKNQFIKELMQVFWFGVIREQGTSYLNITDGGFNQSGGRVSYTQLVKEIYNKEVTPITDEQKKNVEENLPKTKTQIKKIFEPERK